MFWSGISNGIRNAVKVCDICQKHKPQCSSTEGTLLQHDLPSMPWVKLGIDIFKHYSHHYQLVADYFSKFPIVKKLSNQTLAGHVIGLLKIIFAEYGIPAVVSRDQGAQFAFEELRTFAVQYRFQVQHSSPRYPQSHGFIEAMVKEHHGKGRRVRF